MRWLLACYNPVAHLSQKINGSRASWRSTCCCAWRIQLLDRTYFSLDSFSVGLLINLIVRNYFYESSISGNNEIKIKVSIHLTYIQSFIKIRYMVYQQWIIKFIRREICLSQKNIPAITFSQRIISTIMSRRIAVYIYLRTKHPINRQYSALNVNVDVPISEQVHQRQQSHRKTPMLCSRWSSKMNMWHIKRFRHPLALQRPKF